MPRSTRALDSGDRAGAMAEWDALRRSYDTWSALVHLRFAQDTTDAAAQAARTTPTRWRPRPRIWKSR